jgi:membrane-bound metal-dependent hydrolase YbcI (DUF457 family)
LFVGHYGVSFLAKEHRQEIPLWLLFIAVQLIDVFWAIFVLFGIEKVRIVPGYTASSPLDLYYMPYTHSLLGAALWSIAFGAICVFIYRWNRAAGVIVGLAVFSHWILDLFVHRPDLALYDSHMKMGFGLWNYKWLEFILEVLFLCIGIYIYMRSTSANGNIGRYGFIVFAVVLLAIQASQFYTPPPPSGNAVAMSALFAYILFAGIAAWLERKRVPAPKSIPSS